MLKKKDYTLEEIDDIVHLYQSGSPQAKGEALSLLIDIFKGYFLKYVKLAKGGAKNTWDNKDAAAFLSLFGSQKGTARKSFTEIKRDIASTLEPYTHEDIYQELVMIFITILDKYKKRPGINFMRYATSYMRYNLRNYICRVSKDPLFKLSDPSEEQEKEIDPPVDPKNKYFEEQSLKIGDMLNSSEIHPGQLSLAWVMHCDRWIFSHLTCYQRYLLYLYFGKGYGCTNIASLLSRSKDTITKHLKMIFKKIGRLNR